MLKGITIGSDPELFIWDEVENKVVSSIGLIPGVKGEAYLPEGFPGGYGLQIDNILAEFNIPPVTSKRDFIDAINKMKGYIKEHVNSIHKNLTIKCSASEFVGWDQLNSREAKLFGCSPDYNCYTEDANPSPNGEVTNLRTTGMHIHIGYPNATVEESIRLVKYMDMYLGIPSVIVDRDTRRRELYGKAGCFRLCSWGGVEYRTLSGVFIDSEEKIEFVWDQTMKAINAWANHYPLVDEKIAQSLINNGNVNQAISIVQKFKILDIT